MQIFWLGPTLILSAALGFSAARASVIDVPVAECELDLAEGDAFSVAEMAQIRAAAHQLKPLIAEWSSGASKLDPARVARTMTRVRAGLDVDGPPLRLLFGAVGRFLLNAKGADGRQRPLAEALKITEGEVDALVTFFAQLDVLSDRGQAQPDWPSFLRSKATALLEADLRGHVVAPSVAPVVKQIAKTLGRRARYARLAVDAGGHVLTLRSPVGTYVIDVRDVAVVRPSIARLTVQPSTLWGRQNDLNVFARTAMSSADVDGVSYLRTMTRADAFFHPHLVPPTFELYPQPTKPSPVQATVVDKLMHLDVEAEQRQGGQGPVTLGHTMPTGEGKTVVNAAYLRRMIAQRWNGRRPKIILVVENINILRQTVESFERDLGLDRGKISMMFGETGEVEFGGGVHRFTVPRGSKLSPHADFDLVVATRSTLSERESSLKLWIDRENAKAPAERRPFAVIVDEAHHLGAPDGQYQRLLKMLRANLRGEDRILAVSATFSNPNRNIIRDDLGGNIVASHLLEEEMDELRRGDNLDFLSLKQFLRATIEGYVNPIDDESFTLVDDEISAAHLRERLSRRELADKEIYQILARMIRKQRKPGIMDRWAFFEVRQDRARDGAAYLAEAFGDNAVRFMHSGLSTDDQMARMNWFTDRREFRGTRYQHKILETVGQMIEGTDVRGINGIAVMRNLVYDRVAQQILGRGARLEPFKISIRLADVSGRVLKYLESAGDLWENARYRARLAQPAAPRERAPLPPTPPEERGTVAAAIRPHQIDLEKTLARERETLETIRRLEAEHAGALVEGPWAPLSYVPGTGTRAPTLDAARRMRDWFDRFPADVRARAAAVFGGLKWPTTPVHLNALTPAHAAQLRGGLKILVRMYNVMPERARFGLAPLTPDEAETERGLARLFLTLDPEFDVRFAAGYAAAPMNGAEAASLFAAARAGEIFRKDAGQTELLRKIQHAGATESLRLVRALGPTHAVLNAPAVHEVCTRAERAMAVAAGRGDSVDAVATYYLARLLDVLVWKDNPKAHVWDLNPAFGLPKHPGFKTASLYRFWSEIGGLDARAARGPR